MANKNARCGGGEYDIEISQLLSLKSFIEKLPEEPVSVKEFPSHTEDEPVEVIVKVEDSVNSQQEEPTRDIVNEYIDKYIGKDAFSSAPYGQLQRDDVVISNEDDPDKAAVQFSKNVTGGHIYQDLICGFIAGVKWLKEQMMKDVTTATCCGANAFQPVWCFDDLKSGDIAAGDKIKVIIIKEEEQC